MTSPTSTRLERALDLFVEHQRRGGDWQRLLTENADVADLLASFLDEPSTAPAVAIAFCPEDFELVREIGRGGAGMVHEARQLSLGRHVALKMLHESFAGSATALTRFRREAQILARLDHAGIVRIFAVGDDRGRHWLAMELVAGESLAVHIDSLRRRGGHHGDSLRRLVESTAVIAGALQHAHDNGIVHRDVKPSNILLRHDGSAVLGDFGLARDTEALALTHSGITAGTPNYMAPEQVLGANCDARTDVFSLGATLYECLTLRRAFDGDSVQAVLQAVLTGDPVDARQHRRGLPTDLAAIVHKALEKDPALRYQTAAGLVDDLKAFLDLRPISARPPSTTRRLVRLVRRRPLFAVALVMIGVGLVAAGLVLWQLPNVRAAAVVRQNEAFEDEMVAGMMTSTGADPEACYRHFRHAIEIAPERLEGPVGLCTARLHFGGPLAALEELDRYSGAGGPVAGLGRCRALVLRRLQRADEASELERQIAPPTTPLDMYLAALPLLSDAEDHDAVHRASRLLSLAVRISPRPRLLFCAQWATVQSQLDDPDQWREAADTLLRVWPENVLALQLAGVNLLHFDPPRALAVLQHAVQIGPSNGLLWLDLGVALFENQRRDEALATLAEAMPAPDLTAAQRWRVLEIIDQIGDQQLTGDLAEAWLRREPGSLLARRGVARHAARQGDRERAVAMFRACIAEQADFELRMDLAFTLSQGDDLTEARELAYSLSHEQPKLERAHDLLLDVLDLQHDPAAVLDEDARWAAANPADKSAWQTLAAACLQCADADAATRALTASERADYLTAGNDPAILDLRATALERLGRTEEAKHVRARAAAVATGPH